MEASFLADEQFDVRVNARLRAKGHDVVTVRSLSDSKSGDGWSDELVLSEAVRLRRIILTDNVRDFRRLAREYPHHEGIVLCAVEDPAAKANRIDRLVREQMRQRGTARLTGQVIDARPRISSDGS